MNINDLKKFIQQFLFTSSGRFRSNMLNKIPITYRDEIISLTQECYSPNFKDRIYWVLHDITSYKKCKWCGKNIDKPIKNFSKKIKDQDYCCTSCRMSDPDFHKKIHQNKINQTTNNNETNIEQQKCVIASTTLEKRKQTVLQRYGVENVAHVKAFQHKKKSTNLARYGVENINHLEEFRKKIKATNLIRYGEEHPTHIEKRIENSLKKHGVRHPMQNPKVFERVMNARFKIKTFVTETGMKFQYQGYEDVIIKFLINNGIDENLIITNRKLIPSIFYVNPLTEKLSRYYPDIWIKDTQLMFEVKSKFTIKFKPEVIYEKKKECDRQGYHCIIAVCNKRSILEIIL